MKTVEEVVSFCKRMQDDCWAKMQREPAPYNPRYAYWATRRETLGFIIEQIEEDDTLESGDSHE
jgi:hypothetical protein